MEGIMGENPPPLGILGIGTFSGVPHEGFKCDYFPTHMCPWNPRISCKVQTRKADNSPNRPHKTGKWKFLGMPVLLPICLL